MKITTKNSKISLIPFLLIFCVSCFCRQHDKACFTVNKHNAKPGDTINFYNCSSFDDPSSSNFNVYWNLGDGQEIAYKAKDTLRYAYQSKGIYIVNLRIGGVECGSEANDTIKIQ